ncbi:MAG: HD domain-containing protein [Candidatus Omnitrophota bacterium]|nr:HD domain-containing protein [Candidatus Omnitrophota bacterium]
MGRFFKFKSSGSQKLFQKFAISYTIAALIPLLLTLYIFYVVIGPKTEKIIRESELIIFLMVCLSLTGFLFSRKIAHSILRVARNGKAIANGDLSREVDVKQEDELGELSESFNRVTRRLRQNIEELKESKKLIQNILSRVGSAVTSMHDINNLLELIVQVVTNSLNAKSGGLMLIDEKNQELFVKVAYGLDNGLSKTRIKIGEGPIGRVAKENKPQRIGRSFLCVPLVHSRKVIGTLSVNDKSDGSFNQDDVILLSSLSSQTAIAIENARLNQDIERTYFETITALAMAVEAKDQYTRGHSNRVVDYCMMLAGEFGLDKKEKEVLKEAALLHDIGKIGISDAILRKPGRLTKEEYELVKKHTIIGENIMKPVKRLTNLCGLVRHHQEWVDGKGYPDGLKSENMSISLKILMVADSFDAMISNRPYRKALSVKQAKQELTDYSGTHFDKDVVDKFIKLI